MTTCMTLQWESESRVSKKLVGSNSNIIDSSLRIVGSKSYIDVMQGVVNSISFIVTPQVPAPLIPETCLLKSDPYGPKPLV